MAGPDEQVGQEPEDEVSLDASQGQTPDQDADDDAGLGGLSAAELQAENRKLRAEARKRRHSERQLEATVKQYRDRDKSEEQRVQEELDMERSARRVAETKALRYEVAAEHGVSQYAKRLQGETREELVEDAKALVKEFGLSENGQRADFSSGVRRPVQRPKTMNDIIRQAAGR
jgi:hypothetical protein